MAATQLKMRGCLKILCVLLFVFGVVVPLLLVMVAGPSVDSVQTPLQGLALRSHERKPLDYLEVHDNSDHLKFQINELENIRVSVRNELRMLDQTRQHLAEEVESGRDTLDRVKKDIERAKNELQNTKSKLSRAVRQAKRAVDSPPLVSSPDPVIVVNVPGELALPRQPVLSSDSEQKVMCARETCLDFSKCPLHKPFLVYVYNEHQPYSSLFSLKHQDAVDKFLNSLKEVDALTDDPSLACLFVLITGPLIQPMSVDVLKETFHSLPQWRLTDGANHVLVCLPYAVGRSGFKDIYLGRAIVVDGITYQQENAILLPPIILEDDELSWQGLPLHLPAKRQNLAYFEGHQYTDIHSHIVQQLNLIASTVSEKATDRLLIKTSCTSQEVASPEVHKGEWSLCGPPEQRQSHLELSTFSLVLGGGTSSGTQTYTRLVEGLRYGAVPVIIGVSQLPLDSVIDWHRAAVILPASLLGQIHLILKSFSNEDILSFRRQGRFLWRTYFSSPDRMLSSVISLLRAWFNHPPPVAKQHTKISQLVTFSGGGNRRVISPTFQHNFTVYTSNLWNSPPGPFYMYPSTPYEASPVSGMQYVGLDHKQLYSLPQHVVEAGGVTGPVFDDYLLGNVHEEQFTVILLTYERNTVLIQALDRLTDLDHLSKVIVVWNNPSPPPDNMQWPDIGVPLEVVSTGHNSLNNRFLPFAGIETDAILSIDDDVHLRHDEILFAFRVWREARERVVGFPGRFHAYDVRHPGKWLYNSNYTCELSMVLTGAAFLHKYYLYLYSQWLPQKVRDIVDSFINCEDIAMNFLVSHITRKPPIKVTSRWTFRCPGCPDTLSTSDEHFNERHTCINKFTEIFGYVPLLYTQFRADSVLFKTRLPSHLEKCYQFV